MNPETRFCPVIIPARRQQEHSCEKGTTECAWSRDPFKPIQSRKSLHQCLSIWKRDCIPVLSSLPQLLSPQGTTGTFTKIRKAVVPNSESCWVGWFLEGKALYNLSMNSKNKVANGFLETGHIYRCLLKAALISYHSPECVVGCISMIQGLITEKMSDRPLIRPVSTSYL